MLSIAQEYIERSAGVRDVAVGKFAHDLMEGDPDRFKVGYSPENAAVATAKAFDLTDDEVEQLCGAIGAEDRAIVLKCVRRDRGEAA